MKIRHIVNPVSVKPDSDLYIAQPITFASMIAAREEAKKFNIEVDLCFTCYSEDEGVAPREFRKTRLLDRSILDIIDNLYPERKLPLIHDIVERLLNGPEVDFLIYTNVDIAVQMDFYIEVKRIAAQGYDAFTINRRTLPKHYNSPSQLSLMYLDPGEKHPGNDCFIFKPEAAHNFKLGTGCIGANWIGRILLANVMAQSNEFQIFDNKRLTFHIGDDRSWNVSAFNQYNAHNESELVSILSLLLSDQEVRHADELENMLEIFTCKKS